MSRDLTIGEIINDPMIVQLLKADNVPVAAFVQLLQSAARVQLAQAERMRAELMAREETSPLDNQFDQVNLAIGAIGTQQTTGTLGAA